MRQKHGVPNGTIPASPGPLARTSKDAVPLIQAVVYSYGAALSIF